MEDGATVTQVALQYRMPAAEIELSLCTTMPTLLHYMFLSIIKLIDLAIQTLCISLHNLTRLNCITGVSSCCNSPIAY